MRGGDRVTVTSVTMLILKRTRPLMEGTPEFCCPKRSLSDCVAKEDASGTEQEVPVEILTVHLAEDDEGEECSEEDGTANDTARLSGIAESFGALNCSTEKRNLSSSEENSDDQYSDSSEEYFVGAIMTIATDADPRREGGRYQRRNHKRKYRRRKYRLEVGRANVRDTCAVGIRHIQR
ncbi:hypothetical protein B0H13DRAFT_1863778 [Mycena leptocephala]|nr:hypothetical protein B0H13DRAFT_1863778 [Mycena leptocephala]